MGSDALPARTACCIALGVLGLALPPSAAAAVDPATRSALKAGRPAITVSDFGVTVRVALRAPLTRTAARTRARKVGLAVGLDHADGTVSGALFGGRGSRVVTTARRLPAPVVFLPDGRRLHVFLVDPKGASITRVVVGAFALAPARRARAAIESPSSMIDHLVSGRDVGRDAHLGAFLIGLAAPLPRSRGEDCDSLRHQIAGAEKVMQDVTPPFNVTQKVAIGRLKQWLPRARAALAELCAEGVGGAVGGPAGAGLETGASPAPSPVDPFAHTDTGTSQSSGGPSGNAPPTAGFNDAPVAGPGQAKADHPVAFDGTVSDADGSVVSWTWDWGDGSQTSGTGGDPDTTHIYSEPKIYTTKLTVVDDKGATTTHTRLVYVGGEGSKRSDEDPDQPPFDILCPDATFNQGTLDFYVRIPSYAEEPITYALEPDPVCPGATAEVILVERLTGNPDGKRDEWGNLKDRLHIRVRLTHQTGAGGETVSPAAVVSWK